MATVLAAAVNVVGDLALCSGLGLGIAGAAWATVAAQAAAAAVIVAQMGHAAPPPNSRPALLSALPLRVPAWAVWARFARIGGPVAVVICLKVSCALRLHFDCRLHTPIRLKRNSLHPGQATPLPASPASAVLRPSLLHERTHGRHRTGV